MVEEEAFFAAAALTIGPPPVRRTGIGFGTLVGSKYPPAARTRIPPWQRQEFTLKLALLHVQMFPQPGVALEANYNMDRYNDLFDRYTTWYEKEQKIRQAAEAL